MRMRFDGGFVPVMTGRVIAVVFLLAVAPRPAMAAPIAFVELTNCGVLTDTGPTSAGGTKTCGGAEVSGGASFTDGISLTAVSSPGGGVVGFGYLDDVLTFHVPGGGSAQVDITMSGAWGGTYDSSQINNHFQVDFFLAPGSAFYNGHGYWNLAFDDGHPPSDAFSGIDLGGQIVGSFSFSTTWTVSDGVGSPLFTGLKASASNGATAFIDHPVFITLPPGVTFTSASGATYAPEGPGVSVPEPSTMFLLGTGIAAVIARRRARRP